MPSHSDASKSIDKPLYNSRLIRNYVIYVKNHYSEVDIDGIIEYAWINKYELEDQGHWFSQWQVDRFHEMLSRKTKNPGIAREAGRYSVSSTALGAAKQYVMGLMSLMSVYSFMEKLYPIMSRGAIIKANKLGANKVEIISTPKPGVNEKPYQCENRIGTFEALAKWFTRTFAQVEHPSCLHKGDDCCRYIITWEKTPSIIWKRIRSYSLFLGVFISLVFYFILPIMNWMILVVLCAFLIMIFSYYSEHLEKKELIKTIETQGNAAEDLLEEINIRYNDALLIKEIGQATSMLLDTEQLLSSVITVMENRLNYDRGGIWLANKERTRLVWRTGYGYDSNTEKLLKGKDFNLENPVSRGVAVEAFKRQRPYLVNDAHDIEKDLSASSLEFIKKIGAQAFIGVPIVYEKKPLGVLFVDNIKSKRPLTHSDMSLLMGIAPQIGISIHNAMSYQKLQESKQREQNLRTLFEKYVPAPVIKRYVGSEDIDLFRGEESSITALFLDIRGFTSSSERMKASDVLIFLNNYFEKCSLAIREENGHINKYTGDGFFAIFGAPEPIENHATLAFNAACKIMDLSERFLLEEKPMGIGIGIHTGDAILGNLGSLTKIEYTAIGDTVNIAARLQEFTKLFQEFPIIMSKDALEGLAGHPFYQEIRNLGTQKIRGKQGMLDTFGFGGSQKENPSSISQN
ncbi:MAG: GAF domain-containing protein [Deltaproteobacteria bacterium]|nr:GAF domain-containing protein [Deltaproteobacteria bacterium]